ncbi:MAG: 4-hydroxy-3-methylbut-2-enyl diphosphate reductase [Parcubacteria group bacterium]
MKITLSKYAGFCDGVKRAYEAIISAVEDPRVKKPIYVLGSLVHNADVVKSLEDLGVQKMKMDRNLFKNLRALKGKIGTLVITAHGMGPSIYEFCKQEKINLIDTTCPRVMKVQRLAKNFSEKLGRLIVVGDKNHKETKGIVEWSKNTGIVVEKLRDIRKLQLKSFKNVTVLFQTTQNLDLAEVVNFFMHNFCPNAKIMNTICLATYHRQNEVKKIAEMNEAVVVIGSPESANSRRLWEIAKKINSRSYFVENFRQIEKKWLKNIDRIGIAAGASTPQWVINDVVSYLKNY